MVGSSRMMAQVAPQMKRTWVLAPASAAHLAGSEVYFAQGNNIREGSRRDV